MRRIFHLAGTFAWHNIREIKFYDRRKSQAQYRANYTKTLLLSMRAMSVV